MNIISLQSLDIPADHANHRRYYCPDNSITKGKLSTAYAIDISFWTAIS
ncbi:hypothetical protein [Ancylomarina sp.]